MFVYAKELLPEQAILLTHPKAQPLLNKLNFYELARETRGMTFGLYVRKDIEQDLEIAFVRALIFSYRTGRKTSSLLGRGYKPATDKEQ